MGKGGRSQSSLTRTLPSIKVIPPLARSSLAELAAEFTRLAAELTAASGVVSRAAINQEAVELLVANKGLIATGLSSPLYPLLLAHVKIGNSPEVYTAVSATLLDRTQLGSVASYLTNLLPAAALATAMGIWSLSKTVKYSHERKRNPALGAIVIDGLFYVGWMDRITWADDDRINPDEPPLEAVGRAVVVTPTGETLGNPTFIVARSHPAFVLSELGRLSKRPNFKLAAKAYQEGLPRPLISLVANGSCSLWLEHKGYYALLESSPNMSEHFSKLDIYDSTVTLIANRTLPKSSPAELATYFTANLSEIITTHAAEVAAAAAREAQRQAGKRERLLASDEAERWHMRKSNERKLLTYVHKQTHAPSAVAMTQRIWRCRECRFTLLSNVNVGTLCARCTQSSWLRDWAILWWVDGQIMPYTQAQLDDMPVLADPPTFLGGQTGGAGATGTFDLGDTPVYVDLPAAPAHNETSSYGSGSSHDSYGSSHSGGYSSHDSGYGGGSHHDSGGYSGGHDSGGGGGHDGGGGGGGGE